MGEIVNALKLERLDSRKGLSSREPLPPSRLVRVRVSPDGGTTVTTLQNPEVSGGFIDFPAINPGRIGKQYRYIWGLGAKHPTNIGNQIVKIDLEDEQHHHTFRLEGATPG